MDQLRRIDSNIVPKNALPKQLNNALLTNALSVGLHVIQ